MIKNSRIFDKQVSENIKALITKKKVKGVTLAKVLNLAPSSVSDKLLGKSPWKMSELFDLSLYFTMTLSKIAFGETEKPQIMNQKSLNQMIKKTGLKKEFIAKNSLISPIQLSHILSGRRKAKPEVLKKIEKVISKYTSIGDGL